MVERGQADFLKNVLSGPPQFLYQVADPFIASTAMPVGQGQNDYHMLSAAGCHVYAAYVRPYGPNNYQGVFVRRISVCDDTADVNLNGIVDLMDFHAYTADFISGYGRADLDGDNQVSANDAAAYLTRYNAATNPP
jgi:hypothetical protein